ncbi:DsrE family protein [Polynucleobacter antarcticus]|uniref:Uncharacterized protein n=1 Tax=Polynucleobacter antarcticus TaxID=1743162 RepID=A0A6M9PRP4_9BURK|nr:DsrE family protein [Polynucleobacter antarcticus]QKM62542.1 hypothetical protein DCO16_05350 [Polynucleobacter antarcticus]
MKIIKAIITTLLISFAALSTQSAYAAGASVVYHIDDADSQGIKGLRNIRNHKDVAADTNIIVVTHANGVDIMMEGAKDKKNGIEYAPLIAALKSRGVRFEVCEITLKNRNLKKEQFNLDTDYTPSGVARIGELQFKDRYAYIKP